MELFLLKLLSLSNEYGFTLVFAVCATTLMAWVIKITLGHLLSTSKEKDKLIINHISHLSDAVMEQRESIEDIKGTFELLRTDLKDGFSLVSGTFDKGLERQERILGKVLESRCPLLTEENKRT